MEYQINELAKLAGVSNRTLRYYEDIGLLQSHRKVANQYRYYDASHVNQLQHILILREMGLELSQIKELLQEINQEQRLQMMENHLQALEQKRHRIEVIIHTVQSTIQALKGEITMKDKDKFEGLKDQLIQKNDQLYQKEVVERWGEAAYLQSKKAFQSFTKEQYDHFNQLAIDLIETLKKTKTDSNNEILRRQVYQLHKEWLTIAWGGNYQKEAHFDIVEMYVQDERFKAYYNQHQEGLAELLKTIVQEQILMHN